MAGKQQRDDFLNLRDLDLSGVDLADIDLAPETTPPWVRPATSVTLLLLGGAVVWFPRTELYRRDFESSAAFFIISALGLGLGLTAGRLLWRWAEEAAARRPQRPREAKPDTPPSPLWRWFIFLVVVAVFGLVLFVLPRDGAPSNDDSLWYIGSTGAIVAGILLGRWLIMQAQAKAPVERQRIVIKLPPWFKWVTLSGIILTGLVAFVGVELFGGGSTSSDLETSIGGLGFIVGISGAIWIARRFDELEEAANARRAPVAPKNDAGVGTPR